MFFGLKFVGVLFFFLCTFVDCSDDISFDTLNISTIHSDVSSLLTTNDVDMQEHSEFAVEKEIRLCMYSKDTKSNVPVIKCSLLKVEDSENLRVDSVEYRQFVEQFETRSSKLGTVGHLVCHVIVHVLICENMTPTGDNPVPNPPEPKPSDGEITDPPPDTIPPWEWDRTKNEH